MTSTPSSLVLTSYDFVRSEQRSDFRRDRLESVASFLQAHLGPYGDPIEQIRAALVRAAGDGPHDGGTVTLAESDEEIVGAVVTNATHMAGYTPENLLVYIATHSGHRGQGIGRALLERTIEACSGSIALHVEPENPAVYLYRSLGFTQKYLEMRYHR
jgi:GNAT superfamily N-acetyltransferase